MLSDKLKESTKTAHAATEKLLISKIRSIVSKDDYMQLLAVFYGFFVAVQYKTELYIDKQLLPDYPERRNAEFLIADMRGLDPGFSAGSLKLCADLPEISSHEHAMGALYVLEGSTLGGAVIKKLIAEKLELKGETGFRFFTGYGEKTINKWEIFKKALNATGDSFLNKAKVIESANETFEKFKNWIELAYQ